MHIHTSFNWNRTVMDYWLNGRLRHLLVLVYEHFRYQFWIDFFWCMDNRDIDFFCIWKSRPSIFLVYSKKAISFFGISKFLKLIFWKYINLFVQSKEPIGSFVINYLRTFFFICINGSPRVLCRRRMWSARIQRQVGYSFKLPILFASEELFSKQWTLIK